MPTSEQPQTQDFEKSVFANGCLWIYEEELRVTKPVVLLINAISVKMGHAEDTQSDAVSGCKSCFVLCHAVTGKITGNLKWAILTKNATVRNTAGLCAFTRELKCRAELYCSRGNYWRVCCAFNTVWAMFHIRVVNHNAYYRA